MGNDLPEHAGTFTTRAGPDATPAPLGLRQSHHGQLNKASTDPSTQGRLRPQAELSWAGLGSEFFWIFENIECGATRLLTTGPETFADGRWSEVDGLRLGMGPVAGRAGWVARRRAARQRWRERQRLSREDFRSVSLTFSQYGEDLAVLQILHEFPDAPRVYVDVGCFDPAWFSNTALLHLDGWRGMNIDLDAAKTDKFNQRRPNDIDLVAACSDGRREMVRFQYSLGVTTRLSSRNSQDALSIIGETPIASDYVQTTTLNDILPQHGISDIGFLNIDAEGHDLEVLSGLDLGKYRPRIIAIEFAPGDSRISSHLQASGYKRSRIMQRTEIYALPTNRNPLAD